MAVGEQTQNNKAHKGMPPYNSAANVDGADEYVELSTKFLMVAIGNGSRGVGGDSGMAKAWVGKLFFTPWDPLYVSTTYYDSGSLKSSQSEISIAGLISPPLGATHWTRRIWEGDVRYDFGKGKKPLYPLAFSDSKAILRFSYGGFRDQVTNADDRKGEFGFIDGLCNITEKIYTAGRVSLIDLSGGLTASLNNVTTNHYTRYTVGMGYRWFENTHLKLGYDHNTNGGSQEASDDLVSALVAIQF